MKTCPACHSTYPNHFTVCPSDGVSLRASTELEVGAVVRGKYQVLAKLGEGGMGVVYKVRHVHLGDIWALKLVSSRVIEEPGFLQRFRAEALLMRRLDHPNVVHVHDFDETEDGRPFIVMEYVEGESLDRLMTSGTPLDVRRALRITMQACDALAAAHRIGIIHRDIKPANLLVARAPDGGDLVKALDFGVAKVNVQGEESGTALTRTGFVVGTPDYMSPEQAMGVPGHKLDGRTDLYSLGVVLFRTLTGQLPFAADTPMQLLLAHIQANPPDPRTLRADLSPATAAAVLKALEKDRAQRFADAAEMRRALAAALESEESGRSATAPGPSAEPPVAAAVPVGEPRPVPGARKPARARSGWTYLAAYTLVTLGLVVVAAGLWTISRSRPSIAPQPTAQNPSIAPQPTANDTAVTALPAAPVSPARPAAPVDSHGGGTGNAAVQPDHAPITPMRPSSTTTSKTASAPSVSPSPDASDVAMFLDTARKYEQGSGVSQDMTEAVKWYRKAADRGDATGQVNVGLAYLNGRGAPHDDAEAARWFRNAAEQGNARGQNAYGVLLQTGRGVPRNEVEALEWLRASAAQGEVRAQRNLGLSYQKGVGVPQDDVEAVRWYRKAADQNDPSAEVNLGWMLEVGHGVAKNESEAAAWYRKAADQGDPVAATNLAAMYQRGGGVPQDNAQAAAWYRKAADQGFARAQGSLGVLYRRGAGVPQDDAEAVKWYRKAADQNDPVAELNLGWMLESGHGVAKNESEAAAWYRKSADQGLARAQASLGLLYQKGTGVSQDDAEAARWLRRAADQGDATAQNWYGIAIALGRGVAKDEVEATRWFLKAAEQGYPAALFNLGVACGNGRGVTRDTIEAYKWYTLALDAGYEQAGAGRQNIAKGMRPAEVAEAERRAAEWQARHPKKATTPGTH